MAVVGRICNDLRRLKNKCRNLRLVVDITAYVMQSLRMKQNIALAEVKNLIATNHVVFAYPRRGEVVVDGFKRYAATDAVLKYIKAAK